MAANSSKEIRLENLIVLAYTRSKWEIGIYNLADSSELKNENIKLDIEKNTWSYLTWTDVEIGRAREFNDISGHKHRWGVIGIYDRMNTNHLLSMVGDAKYFTEDDSIISVKDDIPYGL